MSRLPVERVSVLVEFFSPGIGKTGSLGYGRSIGPEDDPILVAQDLARLAAEDAIHETAVKPARGRGTSGRSSPARTRGARTGERRKLQTWVIAYTDGMVQEVDAWDRNEALAMATHGAPLATCKPKGGTDGR